MNEAKQNPGPLRGACRAILSAYEINAESLTGVGGTVVTLHDYDGEWLFRVHKDIHESDLLTMIYLHRERFNSGIQVGRERAFAELRAFIGVGAAIAKATPPGQ
jgi:hypothetical protein